MFDYADLSVEEIKAKCAKLPPKIIRWIGINHPDNRTRKLFYRLTNVAIGANTVINQQFVVSDSYLPLLEIGARVAIAPFVTIICDSNPNNSCLARHPNIQNFLIARKKVIIGDDVWIGAGVIILPGVTIGTRSVIGAGSVVVENVPSDTIIAGNPARIIRQLDRLIDDDRHLL